MRLDRLQRQLAEAQALVQAWPEPEQTVPPATSSRDIAIARGPSPPPDGQPLLPVPGAIQAVRNALGSQREAGVSQEAIRYPTIVLDAVNASAAVPAKPDQSAAFSDGGGQPGQPPVKAAMHGAVNFENRDSAPWLASTADFRTPHQRRRDALANARDRLAELQVRSIADASGVKPSWLHMAAVITNALLPILKPQNGQHPEGCYSLSL